MVRMPRAAVVALASAALMVAGCSASGKPTAHPSPSTSAAASASPGAKPVGGTVHLVEYGNGDGAGASVILTGAIGDFGSAVTVDGSGAIDREHSDQVNLALSQGSFRIRVADLDKAVVKAMGRFDPNPHTCSGDVRASGVAPIVEGSGTGAYSGVTGAFLLTVAIAEIVPKSACDATGTSLGQSVLTTGAGTVTFS